MSQVSMFKTDVKNEAKRLRATSFAIAQSWNIDNYIESNREKSNIAITILEKK